MKEGGGNPSVCCGSQLPLHSSHRNSFSSYSGVAHGLFYEKAILWPFRKNAHASAASGLRKGAEGRDNPSVCCGGQLPLRRGAEGNPSVCYSSQLPLRRGAEGNPSVCYAASSPYTGEPRVTPQSAAADSSPYILRTDSALRAAPVLRSAYFPKRVHRTLFSKTLDLQPLCGLRKGAEGGDNPSVCCGRQLPYMLQPQAACEGGAEGGDNPSVRCGG